MPETYLALLRGVNVGGKNKLPMKDLITMFGEAGCRDVQTYIQSGNVIFTADSVGIELLPGTISARIAERFSYRVPLVLRSAAQLAEVVRHNPFIPAGAAEDTLHVMFLAARPSALRIDSLDPDRSPPDQFSVCGQEIYLRLPNGVAQSKLSTGYFDAKLGTTSTARNWRTVTKLLELMGR
jgi:uncharacterized protein (DUF1697 family)